MGRWSAVFSVPLRVEVHTGAIMDIDKNFDSKSLEAECRTLWEQTGIHAYNPSHPGELFAVDTPPPYVSAAHLHVGHAMSYSQAEFIVRYQRMRGRRIFYPMGFDDNGLPTERFVEKTHGIDKRTTTRSEFRALCLEETRAGAKSYEKLWRALGLSVDWSLGYSTIDRHCRRTAQLSFLELFSKGRIYRSSEPVLWDPDLETALAQADLETLNRRAKLHNIQFEGPAGPLQIATTRPELLPGCVALYCHPEDERFRNLIGQTATVPLFAHEVQIRADSDVRPDYGTGLMMVCTFGDSEDVLRWKRDGLETRLCISSDGRMLPTAGSYAGLKTTQARKRILQDIGEAHLGFTMVEQAVSIAERSGVPVEFQMVPQWFVSILDLKEPLLQRSNQLDWHPEWMKARLDHWIRGLKWDWNISRQRFYGVPFPLWLCEDCSHPVLAAEQDLPIDPLEDSPPLDACPECGGALRGDPDVMDTWMTSSLTPQIAANQANDSRRPTLELPLTVRVQAFEIIRTWLFYTLLKAHLQDDKLPWKDVMISGWGLNEQGKKISKRDLEKHTDANGYNRYEPYGVIEKYGADALRHWAARSHLGHDTRYGEKAVRAGRKVVVKLWNAARLAQQYLEGFDPNAERPAFENREPEDRWMLTALREATETARAGFERYDYATGLEALDRFLWGTYCDDWLEMIKDRFWAPEGSTPAARASAQSTLWEATRVLLGLYAPFLPFVTEALYQRLYREREGSVSLHITAYPEPVAEWAGDVPEMRWIIGTLRVARGLRSERRLPQGRRLEALHVDLRDLTECEAAEVRALESTLQTVTRTERITWCEAAHSIPHASLRVDLGAELTDPHGSG